MRTPPEPRAARPAPYLPFTRPAIDEATIAGVVEVLRSGWITSGPQVKQFEAELSSYFGGRPVRTLASGTGALELALAIADIGPGDEVDHDAALLGGDSERRGTRGRSPRVRRHRSGNPQHRSRARRIRDHRNDPCSPPGGSGRIAGGPRPALRDRPASRTARDRGCRPEHGRDLERPAHRQLRRPRVRELPREQEPHHRRRRLPRAERRRRKRCAASGCACRA